MTPIFETIARLVPVMHGWCSVPKAQSLAATVIALRPETSVIIGIAGGRDTIALALAHKETGRGQVIAIDPWTNAASIEGQTGANVAWWGALDHSVMRNDFFKRVEELGLGTWIQVEEKPSDAVTPPENIGLLIVDGNHGPQAIKDVERFGPKVSVGGIVLADDLDWEGGNVRQAYQKLISMGFRELYRIDQSAVLQRIAR